MTLSAGRLRVLHYLSSAKALLLDKILDRDGRLMRMLIRQTEPVYMVAEPVKGRIYRHTLGGSRKR